MDGAFLGAWTLIIPRLALSMGGLKVGNGRLRFVKRRQDRSGWKDCRGEHEARW
ncbi:hypothetical protein BDV98DRAFT_571473, partial [Pterulicium gracile]